MDRPGGSSAEKIGRAHVGAMLRLTLLATDIVEAILDGRQVTGVTLEAVMAGRRGLEGAGHAIQDRTNLARRSLTAAAANNRHGAGWEAGRGEPAARMANSRWPQVGAW